MKPTSLILIMALILAGSLIAAGCLQDSGSTASTAQPTSASQPATPAGTPAVTDGQHQARSGGFASNETRIAAAAAKLGVSEDALRQALNSTAGGRPDFASAAQQLGVTQQQLSDALGIPSGGFTGHRMNATTAAPAS